MREATRSGLLILLSVAQPSVTVLSSLVEGGTPEEVQARRSEGAVTPAGGAFAIWAPLFAGSVAYAVRSVEARVRADPARRRVDHLLAATWGVNVLWSLNTQFRRLDAVSVALITGSAAAATAALLAADTATRSGSPLRRDALVVGPLAGWLPVAACANVDTTVNLLGGHGPAPAGNPGRSVALVALASGVAATVSRLSHGNPGHAAATVWGLGGIAVKAARLRNRAVAGTALGGIAVVLGAGVAGRRASARHR